MFRILANSPSKPLERSSSQSPKLIDTVDSTSTQPASPAAPDFPFSLSPVTASSIPTGDGEMKVTVMTVDEQILTLDVDPDESVSPPPLHPSPSQSQSQSIYTG
jgi:hypothetical protein